jgi:hypothetical protein
VAVVVGSEGRSQFTAKARRESKTRQQSNRQGRQERQEILRRQFNMMHLEKCAPSLFPRVPSTAGLAMSLLGPNIVAYEVLFIR